MVSSFPLWNDLGPMDVCTRDDEMNGLGSKSRGETGRASARSLRLRPGSKTNVLGCSCRSLDVRPRRRWSRQEEDFIQCSRCYQIYHVSWFRRHEEAQERLFVRCQSQATCFRPLPKDAGRAQRHSCHSGSTCRRQDHYPRSLRLVPVPNPKGIPATIHRFVLGAQFRDVQQWAPRVRVDRIHECPF